MPLITIQYNKPYRWLRIWPLSRMTYPIVRQIEVPTAVTLLEFCDLLVRAFPGDIMSNTDYDLTTESGELVVDVKTLDPSKKYILRHQ